MKFSTATVAAFAAVMGSVSAAPHAHADNLVKRDADCATTAHHHHHQHKRAVAVEYVYSTVVVNAQGETITPSSTQTTLEPSSSAEAVNRQVQKSSSASSSSTSTSTSSSAETSSTQAASSSSKEESSSTSTSSTSSSTSTGGGSSGGIYGDLSSFSNPTKEFQDDTIDCTDFDSLVGQGVIALDNLDFGGFSGIYHPSDTSTGGSCKEGAYCSYACQPGMSKTQWPSSQPGNGVSVGGLVCKNGKLRRSNTDQKYLCEWGVDAAYVKNELSKDVAICRTDYPGTENMVIPTYVQGGKTLPLTVVDQSTYYQWGGKGTSAQYYVNDAGVSYEKGCVWGSEGSGIGNWAPLNFGAGAVNGISYLSLIPNPNNNNALNFNVKIVAADDDSVVSGDCKYENGKYLNGQDGCTAGVTKGKAVFVLYN
ncbi:Septation protein [Wickerhamomyces ciferrii]|uniref:Septation protein n=1 Tax=Wickerhamomyces ciferrii (strain ATCC 14091 / BCRC 22168 / CBS 111 / JCM 3599 / NBRC 0793 / NRRL Y-1031 F-60-10) TaxID=1206466 RepID=K0KGF1_WICCF|nr:Septation protein [Wickerhamomyces ciferrii]CCH42046.1 Septation protein [Wickerhamomyces ciferrii]